MPLGGAPSLLGLPLDMRRPIYLRAGLRCSVIHLNHLLPKGFCQRKYKEVGLELGRAPPASYITRKSISLSRFLDKSLPAPRIRLNRRCDCGSSCTEPGVLVEGQCEPFTLQSIYVCRTIAREVLMLFYSENRFSIVRTDPGRLSGLQSFKCAG